MKIIKWLSVILSISLGANLWFLWYFYATNESPRTPAYNGSGSYSPSAKRTDEQDAGDIARDNHGLAIAKPQDGLASNIQGLGSNAIDTAMPNEPELERLRADRSAFLNYLKALDKQQKFVTLDYEVSDYLRQYPQDIEALLLEAKAYYHTQPLNIALVHYMDLLSKPLPREDRDEIEKLIAVNTTRVVQQFTSDNAWDLLAEFLEPLVQIDPLNRQYLMALARAYGMQQQFTLMEDMLATFASDDARANRLRENVFARLNNETVIETPSDLPPLDETPFGGSRVADVLLKQSRGQFVTQARVHNTLVNLLVDTGASTTAISDIKFSSIPKPQVEFLGLFNVNTAGGTIEAPIYKVKQFTLGQRTLNNTSVLILPSNNLSQYDGLLGMNVISQFDLAFDATSETMRMYKKR